MWSQQARRRQRMNVNYRREVVLSFPVPYNEPQRLRELRTFDILDTAPEAAAQICGCPVAFISFIDDDRRWLKAKYGLPTDISEAPRETAVCATTICGTEV
jgi:adenylate cyclase